MQNLPEKNAFRNPGDNWSYTSKDNLKLHQKILNFENRQARELEVCQRSASGDKLLLPTCSSYIRKGWE